MISTSARRLKPHSGSPPWIPMNCSLTSVGAPCSAEGRGILLVSLTLDESRFGLWGLSRSSSLSATLEQQPDPDSPWTTWLVRHHKRREADHLRLDSRYRGR